MALIDTHCHLDDEQLASIRADVLRRAAQAGVVSIVAVGTTLQSSRECIAIAATSDAVVAAVGIHPNHCGEADPGDWERVTELAHAPRVVGIGETGLDRYWDHTPFDVQRDNFDRHIRLSQTLRRPLVIHMRDCDEDVLEMLRAARKRGPLYGVMHSFTGQPETARECLDLGLYLSFAGMVTYKKSDALRQIAASVPDDRILIETDAPYLSPHPQRAHRPNEPALIVHTAECLAAVRGVTVEQFAAQTTRNARQVFGLPVPR